MTPTNSLTITRPDDWHIHLRDGDALERTTADAAKVFARAIVMPNLVPPITNAGQALAYKERITRCIPKGTTFEPLMVLYLTDQTSPQDIIDAKKQGIVACKLYPAGATTNSASGVTSVANIKSVLEEMQNQGILLLVHGEVTDSEIDIFDREKVFIDQILSKIVSDFPKLKIVLEHITTKDAVEFVNHTDEHVGATITAHHLLFNRNHLLVGGIKPHYYCLPVLKRNVHQIALLEAATSGSKKFFLGTDSAPHTQSAKEAACGCAGCYTAYHALELYAQAFESVSALDKLEAFASFFGPDFYGLARNSETITLTKEQWVVPEKLSLTRETSVIPLQAGECLQWKVTMD